MKAKIHFLAINATEFSKILTEARHQYLNNLFYKEVWHHQTHYKYIVCGHNPAEIREILDRDEIPYFYTVNIFTL